MNQTESLICGIDLGTTNSCIAVLKDGIPVVVNIDGQPTMPSVIAWKEGEWLAGKAARNHLWVSPTDGVASIKRKMDDPGYRVMLGGQSLSPVAVSAHILKALVQGAERELGCSITKAVITVPAWFQEQQRQATLEAGRQAGLDVQQIVNEPTAAAIAHERIHIAEGAEEHWLVYDLGGGTFDVSLLSVTSASYEVLASAGNTFLGGDDFDHRLFERFVTKLRDQHNVDPSLDLFAKARLQLLAEQTKIRLSDETQVHLQEPITIGGKTYTLDLHITRDELEILISDLIDSTEEKVVQVLADAGFKAQSLDKLLLVGGSTRIPVISERLSKRFGINAEHWLDPDLSVAIGACIRAAITSGQRFDRSVIDICPHSLGIAALGDEDLKDDDWSNAPTESKLNHPRTFVPLIRRNTRLPASFVRRFYKSSEYQSEAIIAVYQGEHSNTRQNNFIGEFLAQLTAGGSTNLDVNFAYDINGTIKISVTEGDGGMTKSYTMNLSRSHGENSDSYEFKEAFLDSPSEPDHKLATNFLIERASQKLKQQGDGASPEIATLIARYQVILGSDDADHLLDELEDQLYEWVEGE